MDLKTAVLISGGRLLPYRGSTKNSFFEQSDQEYYTILTLGKIVPNSTYGGYPNVLLIKKHKLNTNSYLNSTRKKIFIYFLCLRLIIPMLGVINGVLTVEL